VFFPPFSHTPVPLPSLGQPSPPLPPVSLDSTPFHCRSRLQRPQTPRPYRGPSAKCFSFRNCKHPGFSLSALSPVHFSLIPLSPSFPLRYAPLAYPSIAPPALWVLASPERRIHAPPHPPAPSSGVCSFTGRCLPPTYTCPEQRPLPFSLCWERTTSCVPVARAL